MYVLLIFLSVIIFIHSILFIFNIQKNTELMDRIDQLERKNAPLKTNIQRQSQPRKETKKSDLSFNKQKTKPMKRGSRQQ